MKPSSQLNRILFGKIVFDPSNDPLVGTASGPQSLANIISQETLKKKTVI